MEGVSRRLDLGADRKVAVDLAVVGDDVAPVGRMHRLVTGGRKIDDRQAAVHERGACLAIDLDIMVVRPATRETHIHRPGDFLNLLGRLPLGRIRDKASDAHILH